MGVSVRALIFGRETFGFSTGGIDIVYSGPEFGVAACKTTGRYGKGFDTGPPQFGAVSLSFCCFLRFLVVALRLPAGVPTLPALFYGLRSCVGVSVDRDLPVIEISR